MSDIEENISYMLVRVCRALRTNRAHRLARFGLHCGQDLLLIEVGSSPGLMQAALCERLDVEPPTVTKMVQRMERAGTIRRQPDPSDARVMRLYLTDEGQALLEKVRDCWATVERDLLQNFSLEERVLLKRLLQQVLTNVASTP